jgi:hypothetical protein
MALSGLQAIGASERHALMKEAIAPFGAKGPSEDREERMDQLAKIDLPPDLDSRYYACKESVDLLLRLYVIHNAEAFR